MSIYTFRHTRKKQAQLCISDDINDSVKIVDLIILYAQTGLWCTYINCIRLFEKSYLYGYVMYIYIILHYCRLANEQVKICTCYCHRDAYDRIF